MRIVILSKDRACQLDRLLRSLKKNCADYSKLMIAVFYDATTPAFEAGYSLTKTIYPEVEFQKQQHTISLIQQLNAVARKKKADLFTFFVDDLCVIHSFSLHDAPFLNLKKDKSLTSLSLRLHPGISYCQPLQTRVLRPKFSKDFRFDWKEEPRWKKFLWAKEFAPPQGDWAGPMSMDGNVFRYQEFIEYLERLPEVNYLTQLEPIMNQNPMPGRQMIFYSKPRVLNLAMNRVDPTSPYPSAAVSVEALNQDFLRGKRLDYSSYLNREEPSCHIKTEVAWESSTVCV